MNYGFFFNSFLLCWQQTCASRCLDEARLCPGACCPASPSAQGTEQRCCSREGTMGRSQVSAAPAQPNPLAGASNLGNKILSHPPEPSHGASVRRSRERPRLNAFVSVQWPEMGQPGMDGEKRILQNEDKVELSSRACGGNGPPVCWQPRGRCGAWRGYNDSGAGRLGR